MTTDDFLKPIERAQALGFLSALQADLLKEELSMFPISGSVVGYMLRKGLITAEQGAELVKDPDEDELAVPPVPSGQSGTGLKGEGAGAGPAPVNPESPYSLRPAGGGGSMMPGGGDREPPARGSSAPPGGLGGGFRLNAEPQGHGPQSPQQDSSAPRKSIAEALQASRQAMRMSDPAPASGSLNVSVGSTVSRTGAGASGPVNPDPQLLDLFKMGRERECSDLHLSVGKSPYLRQQGRLFFLPEQPLSASVSKRLVYSVLRPEQQEILEKERQLDFSFEAPGVGRFRANFYHQRLGIEAAFRFIPTVVPTLKSLGFPPVVEKLTTYPQGLNLVTGPGGSGKTTTVAAMLEHINVSRAEHIITVEDPVEYVFEPKMCQITQREVGTHTQSFADALRTALRQDPDVIMIGELRDLETTSIAITASETGHLVFGTLHTAGAIRTVARILDVYPPNQRQQICMMVAESLRGIISQQLLPRKDGQGRVCAMEILVVTTGVSQVIKEGKTHQLVSHMQSGRKLGMKSMDDALMELAQGGLISGATAYAYADNKPAFELIRNS